MKRTSLARFRAPYRRLRRALSRTYFHLRWEALRRPPYHVSYYGYRLAYEPGDALVSRLAQGEAYEPEVIACALAGLPRDAIVFDVGANIGLVALAVARHIPQGHLYCFEPSPHPQRCLARTIADNALAQRITLCNMAVSHTVGEQEFSVHDPKDASGDGLRDTGRAGAARPIRVPVTTLDTYVAAQEIKQLDLLKIDTEGAELDVLRGATSTIRRFRPRIIFEAWPANVAAYGIDIKEVFAFLQEQGYRVMTLAREELDVRAFVRYTASTAEFLALPHHEMEGGAR